MHYINMFLFQQRKTNTINMYLLSFTLKSIKQTNEQTDRTQGRTERRKDGRGRTNRQTDGRTDGRYINKFSWD